jgi:hypothetical protein
MSDFVFKKKDPKVEAEQKRVKNLLLEHREALDMVLGTVNLMNKENNINAEYGIDYETQNIIMNILIKHRKKNEKKI